MTTNEQSSIEKFNNTLADVKAIGFQTKVISKENNMSTIHKLNTNAFEQAVKQYPSLAAICNDLQNLKSLQDMNATLVKRCEALTIECETKGKKVVALKETIDKLEGLTLEMLALLAIGYFYPVILPEIVGGVLLFYCGGTIAVTAPKIAKAYNNLLKKLENLLNR